VPGVELPKLITPVELLIDMPAVDEKVRLLDEIFDTLKRPADDEVDPPTVVADKR